MNPVTLRLAAAGLAVVLTFGAGWQVRSWYDEAKEAAVLKAEAKTRDMMAALAAQVSIKTESAIQGIRIENRTIYNKTQKEILRDTVYRDCVVPAGGVQLINQARAAGAGKPASAVPGNAGVK